MTKMHAFLSTTLTKSPPAMAGATITSTENENRWRMVADAVSLFRVQYPLSHAGSIEAEWLRAKTAIDTMLMATNEAVLPSRLTLPGSSVATANVLSKNQPTTRDCLVN